MYAYYYYMLGRPFSISSALQSLDHKHVVDGDLRRCASQIRSGMVQTKSGSYQSVGNQKQMETWGGIAGEQDGPLGVGNKWWRQRSLSEPIEEYLPWYPRPWSLKFIANGKISVY